jgi:hypothetical protein
MNQYLVCSASFYEAFQREFDVWGRELRRARRQLSRIGA